MRTNRNPADAGQQSYHVHFTTPPPDFEQAATDPPAITRTEAAIQAGMKVGAVKGDVTVILGSSAFSRQSPVALGIKKPGTVSQTEPG